jgi:hypothetical protein
MLLFNLMLLWRPDRRDPAEPAPAGLIGHGLRTIGRF